jgi:hypothetical protein
MDDRMDRIDSWGDLSDVWVTDLYLKYVGRLCWVSVSMGLTMPTVSNVSHVFGMNFFQVHRGSFFFDVQQLGSGNASSIEFIDSIDPASSLPGKLQVQGLPFSFIHDPADLSLTVS